MRHNPISKSQNIIFLHAKGRKRKAKLPAKISDLIRGRSNRACFKMRADGFLSLWTSFKMSFKENHEWHSSLFGEALASTVLKTQRERGV
jgi:hypothetical protein